MSARALSARAGMRAFSTRFAPAEELPARLADPSVLALIEYGDGAGDGDPDPRRVRVGLPQLGAALVVEVWQSNTPVETGTRGNVAYSMNEHVLMGHITVDDAEYPTLEAAAREAYETLLPVAAQLGFPHYLRLWNYIPDINGEQDGMERYKAFCVGRHASFEQFAMRERQLPAASGVGTPSGGLLVYFLAARNPGLQVENPRQVSAFHYPRRYGPKSPAFSRAMVKDWGAAKHLYISGTASIVGHASRHRDRVVPQAMESLRNMAALIRSARDEHGTAIRALNELTQIKVYLRNAGDLDAVRDCIEREVGDAGRVLYLAGDLCRRNLLVELEGLYTE